MWFSLALLALSMLVVRRSAEKSLSAKVDSLAMSWLQQIFAMPFIVGSLFAARFYMPTELPGRFWEYMVIYVLCCAIDLYCYFKALSLADVSYISPLISLVAVGNIVGAYFVLGQVPTIWAFGGACLIICGAYMIHKSKRAVAAEHFAAHRKALLLILLLVGVRSYFSNIEVFMLRDANPTTFNFYSSLLTIPVLMVASLLMIRHKKLTGYWHKITGDVRKWYPLLLLIGVTYTINMLATYQAKLVGPNAGYVGAVKSAQLLPMMFIGALFFKENVTKRQWSAAALILLGLVGLSVG